MQEALYNELSSQCFSVFIVISFTLTTQRSVHNFMHTILQLGKDSILSPHHGGGQGSVLSLSGCSAFFW